MTNLWREVSLVMSGEMNLNILPKPRQMITLSNASDAPFYLQPAEITKDNITWKILQKNQMSMRDSSPGKNHLFYIKSMMDYGAGVLNAYLPYKMERDIEEIGMTYSPKMELDFQKKKEELKAANVHPSLFMERDAFHGTNLAGFDSLKVNKADRKYSVRNMLTSDSLSPRTVKITVSFMQHTITRTLSGLTLTLHIFLYLVLYLVNINR